VNVKIIDKFDATGAEAENIPRPRLIIEKLPNLHINYHHVASDASLILKLNKIEGGYELKVTLPNSILVEDQHEYVSNQSNIKLKNGYSSANASAEKFFRGEANGKKT